MTTISIINNDGQVIAKGFPNQEGLTFYVRSGMVEQYHKIQDPKLSDCPIEVLDVLPGEKTPKPQRIPNE